MIEPESFLRRLARLAARAPRTELPAEPPFGFTTRVLAHLSNTPTEHPWERLAVRGAVLGIAAAVLPFALPGGVAPVESESSGLAQHIIQTSLEP